MYYLEKQGAYGHGVFWIGRSLEDGKKEADIAANADTDDYHDWNLLKLSAPNDETDYAMDADNGKPIYTGKRGTDA